MIRQDLKKFDLPDAPGVYYFLGSKKETLYVGKATSLKDRVRSYFARDILLTRGLKIEQMLKEVTGVKYVQTDSVLEALILEANEIKRLQPAYNTRDKDDKSYNYVVITKEDYPRILVTRGRDLEKLKSQEANKLKAIFGPYPKGNELREALKIVRKIFPYRDKCKPCILSRLSASVQRKSAGCKPCFNAQIGLCPGVCAGWLGKREYKRNICHIRMFFEGNKPKLIKTLEREMTKLAKAKKFEEAEQVKRQLFALDHIQDIALIKKDFQANEANKVKSQEASFRVEAYDIAHMGGRETVGVMTVVVDGELDKSQYRKFKIRKDSNDDVGNLKEILERRFNHPEWAMPNLIVVDGGKAQINVAKKVQKEIGIDIPVVAVTKDDKHKAKEVVGSKQYTEKYERAILLANSEAHRFAINYHRKLRSKGFRI